MSRKLPDALERMYEVANHYEASVLDELQERAGITWTCRTDDHTWTNQKGEPCERCGRSEATP